ncbi:unnamed protein product [Enterobius vermicularis]|uniref:Ribosome-recycling factor, mitochondrial n=1 Tax=Enterobius vermicularis TaxID=51028 RepID=A0A0N4VJE2_ENTVE|nr:unnamed protein product [Enterobius vermicularis]
MDDLEKTLEEELAKHFSLQFDIRQYENLPVELEDNQVAPLSKLGRVSMLNPQVVSVNFTENPAALKPAKLAIEKSNLEVSPQQDGLSLFMHIPKLTRERRERLAASAKKTLFNDYKTALNEVIDKDMKAEDERRKTHAALLAMKRQREAKGLERIEAARAVLLKEVA